MTSPIEKAVDQAQAALTDREDKPRYTYDNDSWDIFVGNQMQIILDAAKASDTVFAGKHDGCTYERAHVHPDDSPEEAHYLDTADTLDVCPSCGVEDNFRDEYGTRSCRSCGKTLTLPEARADALDSRELGRRIMALPFKVDGGTEVVARSQVFAVIRAILAERQP